MTEGPPTRTRRVLSALRSDTPKARLLNVVAAAAIVLVLWATHVYDGGQAVGGFLFVLAVTGFRALVRRGRDDPADAAPPRSPGG